ENPPEQIYDALLLPVLSSAKLDRRRGGLDEEDERFIYDTTQALVSELAAPQTSATEGPPASKRVRVLAVPARDRADELALEMLRKLADPLKWDIAIVGVDVLSAEVATLLDDQQPDILCLGAVLPGGLTRIR